MGLSGLPRASQMRVKNVRSLNRPNILDAGEPLGSIDSGRLLKLLGCLVCLGSLDSSNLQCLAILDQRVDCDRICCRPCLILLEAAEGKIIVESCGYSHE